MICSIGHLIDARALAKKLGRNPDLCPEDHGALCFLQVGYQTAE